MGRVADNKAFTPQARYPGSSMADHSDGNLVTPLVDS